MSAAPAGSGEHAPNPRENHATTPAVPASRFRARGADDPPGGVPDRVGRYEVVRPLGRGGMGVVYEARDPELDRRVAVKVDLTGESGGRLERFRRETDALARLEHPHIVPIFDTGTDDGRPYFVMEFADRGSLKGVTGRPHPPRDAARLLALLAGAVEEAHRRGVIHRDLKPANILLAAPSPVAELNTAWGCPKVADFGLARPVVAPAAATRPGVAVGTPLYMAPEQVRGDPAAQGPGTDVYGLGTILYELLAGCPPFAPPDLEEKVRAARPAPPSAANPAVPPALDAICLRCLEKDPADRFPTAAALARAVADWLAAPAAGPDRTAVRVLVGCRAVFPPSTLTAPGGAAHRAALVRRHDALFRDTLAAQTTDARVLEDAADGLLAAVPAASDAVRAAVRFQQAVAAADWGDGPIRSRVVVHTGEVTELATADPGKTKPVGPAVDTARALLGLAGPGQTLLTNGAFDDARASVGGPADAAGLAWRSYGAYQFADLPGLLAVNEVGVAGAAPLTAPPDTPAAQRNVAPVEAETIAWKPGVGVGVPGRENWELVGCIGRGGFGEVWRARQTKTGAVRVFKFCFDPGRLAGLRKEVAFLQVIRRELAGRTDIAQVHDWKVKGEPPFFLEVDDVPGGSLLDWGTAARLAGLPPDARLGLVAGAAEAVAAAHNVGIIHCDLKPANVLVRETPDGPRAVLTDFGISRITNPDLFRQHQVTVAGTETVLGNSSGSGSAVYLAPEVIAGRQTPNVRSDVYALGVMLYQAAVADLARPLASGWEREVADPLVRADVAACVDTDPANRPASAAEVARAVRSLPARREAAAEHARRGRRRAARRRVAVGLFALLAVGYAVAVPILLGREAAARSKAEGLSGSLKVALGSAEELAGQKDALAAAQAKLAAEKDALARENAGLAADLVAENGMRLAGTGDYPAALPWFAQAVALSKGDAGRESLNRSRLAVAAAESPALARVWFHDRRVDRAAFTPDGTRLVTAEDGPDGGSVVRVWDFWAAGSQTPVASFPVAGRVDALDVGPDGRRVLVRGTPPLRPGELPRVPEEGAAEVWDLGGGPRPPSRVWNHERVRHAEFHPTDGARVVAAHADNSVAVWQVGSPEPAVRVGRSAPARPSDPARPAWDDTGAGHDRVYASFAPGGGRIVTARADGSVEGWDASTGRSLGPPTGPPNLVRARFDSPGRAGPVVVDRGGTDWAVAVKVDAGPGYRWAVPGDRAAGRFDRWDRLVVRDDGRQYLRAGERGTVVGRLAARDAGGPAPDDDWLAPRRDEGGPEIPLVVEGTTGAAFSPDGRLVATAGADGAARTWDARTGRPVGPPVRSDREVTRLLFSPDGRWLVTVSADQTTRAWDLRPRRGGPPEPPRAEAVVRRGGAVVVVDPDTDRPRFPPAPVRPGAGPFGAVVCPADRLLAAWGADGVSLSNARTGVPVRTLAVPDREVPTAVAFSPAGRYLAAHLVTAFDRPPALQVWDTTSGAVCLRVDDSGSRNHPGGAVGEFSRDEAWLMAPGPEGTAVVWDLATGQPIGPAVRHPFPVTRFALAADRRAAATAATDGVRVWDLPSFRPVGPPLRHTAPVGAVAVGGGVVATVADNQVRVWDAGRGELLAPPIRLPSPAARVAVGDGPAVVAWTAAGRVQLWPAAGADPAGADPLGPTLLRAGVVLPAGATRPVPLDRDRLKAEWRPPDLRPDPAWHRDAARDCEDAGHWAAVRWHLGRASGGRPTADERVRMGRAAILAGDLEAAQADLQSLSGGPADRLLTDLARAHTARAVDSAARTTVRSPADAGEAVKQCETAEGWVRKLPSAEAREEFRAELGWCYEHLAHSLLRSRGVAVRATRYVAAFAGAEGAAGLTRAAAADADLRAAVAPAAGWVKAALALTDGVPAARLYSGRNEPRQAYFSATYSADLMAGLGDTATAEALYRRAVDAATAWQAVDPLDDDAARQNFSVAAYMVAELRRNRGDLPGAEEFHRKSFDNDLAWVSDQPDNEKAREMLMRYSSKNLLDVLTAQGKRAAALELLGRQRASADDYAARTPRAFRTHAEAYRTLGMALEGHGDYAASRAAWLRALDFWVRAEQAAVGGQEREGCQEGVGEAHEWLADVCRGAGWAREAVHHGRETVRVRLALLADRPDDPGRNRNAALAHLWLAHPSIAAGDMTTALDAYQAALGAATRAGGDRTARQRQAQSHYALAGRYRATGESAAAEDHLRKALAIRVGDETPGDRDSLLNLGLTRLRLAAVLLDAGKADEARAALAAAGTTFDALRSDADVPSLLNRADVSFGLADVELRARNWAAAARHLEAVLAVLDPAADRLTPEAERTRAAARTELEACRAAEKGWPSAAARRALPPATARAVLGLQAAALVGGGDHAGAADVLRELREAAGDDPAALYDLATWYSHFARLTPDPARRARYAAAGVAALADVARRSSPDLGLWLTDGRLDLLRPSPDFRALVERLDSRRWLRLPLPLRD